MHAFPELIDRCTTFTLHVLNDAHEKIIEELQTSAATPLVKNLQMIQLQKVISAVGMFSIFNAMLQDRLKCADGFKEAANILEAQGDNELNERFLNLRLAINVLKHGEGRSYLDLVAKASSLPFRIKLPGESFFDEGDVSEVRTLIEVNDAFVIGCAECIHAVSAALRKQPGAC